ncbi:MAG: hypothetical protein ACRD8A_18420 [Candidatus Acidiferrales bacterium]
MFAYIVGYFLARMIASLLRVGVRTAVARKGGRPVIRLDLRTARTAPPSTLCTRCVFSHIVVGYELTDRIVSCGFALPLREVPFAVKECTDFRTARPMGMDVLELQKT